MSMMVPHFTASSPRHGTGLFTPIPLQPGALLWCFDPAIDRRLPLRNLEPRQLAELLHFGYVNPERPAFVVVCGDHARFWNFPRPGEPANARPSDQIKGGEAVIVASRMIAAGEELLIHPSSDADYFRKMGLCHQQPAPGNLHN
jgi:hypothetical protein